MKPKFLYNIETKKLFKPKFDDEYASNFSYQDFTSRFLLNFHLNPFQINVDYSLFCFSNYTFKLISFFWLYFTKIYEARILQNRDVPVSDTDTPRILADTYPRSISINYFDFLKIFYRILI